QPVLVDELIVYVAPKLLGTQARGLSELPGFDKLADAPQFTFSEIRHVGPDVCVHMVSA
uniref:dihydrofolate reductase family protein n=1 Tax=Salmonella enterica TaxID=28901 RepID=UPI003298ED60